MIRTILSLGFLFLFFPSLYSQDISGTWEGTLDGREKLQINIKMKKMRICGYTWDYDIRSGSSYCKATFTGYYDADEKNWVLAGNSFMENSGGHFLMFIRLWNEPGDPKNVMRGTVESKQQAMSLFNMGGGRDRVRLQRVSTVPSGDMPDCFPETPKKYPTVKPLPKNINPQIKRPEPAIVPVVKKPTTKILTKPLPVADSQRVIKNDSAVNIIPKRTPVVLPKNPEIVSLINSRRKTALRHIIVPVKDITIKVYDNGVVDNDTVSIFYNGRMLAGKKGLSEKPLTLQLTLDENSKEHEITMFAENLGSIAPNTALIVVTAGKKRYELHASSSLTESAVLSFEYKPE